MRYINKNIKNLVRIYPNQERSGYLRLDMNENPGGLPIELVERVLLDFSPEFLSTYPEPNIVTELWAKQLSVNKENIFLANGSDACIRYIFEVFGFAGAKVVTVNPTFEMYKVYSKMFGLVHQPVDYGKDLQVDYKKIVEAIDADTCIVALVNPNNPVGNTYTEQEARAIVDRALLAGAIVVIDEAYHYFCESTLLGLANEYDNVIVLRTFSKLMSLAACRLGVAIANENIIRYLKNAQPTFEVNSVALKFAEHILQDEVVLKQLVDIEKKGHSYLVECIRQAGYELIDGKGNYIFIKTKKAPALIAQLLEQEKILIKTYSNELLQTYIRVSTGDIKYMQIFLDRFLALDNN